MKAKHRTALQKSISRSLSQTRADYDRAIKQTEYKKPHSKLWAFFTLVAIATTIVAGGFYYG